MDIQEEYKKSRNIWVSEQQNLISILEINIPYLEKEIELKQISLQLAKEALAHEIQYLQNYLKNQ